MYPPTNIHTTSPMIAQPSKLSSALAGLWSGIGFAAFVTISKQAADDSILKNDFIWLVVFAVFLALPVLYFVYGRRGPGLSKNWINVPEERARYFVMVQRMMVWLASAVVTGGVMLLLLRQVLPPA
jgi:hypothetical protein